MGKIDHIRCCLERGRGGTQQSRPTPSLWVVQRNCLLDFLCSRGISLVDVVCGRHGGGSVGSAFALELFRDFQDFRKTQLREVIAPTCRPPSGSLLLNTVKLARHSF